MSKVVLLDTGPLGMVTHPRAETNREALMWLDRLLGSDVIVRAPEIADYEIRRELLLANKPEGVHPLESLAEQVGYLPITTEAVRLAARFWAVARNQGRPTAPDLSLDADGTPAAQALLAEEESSNEVVVATTNPRHLSRFVDALFLGQGLARLVPGAGEGPL